MEYDLILKSGTVHDGSGGPSYVADVAVSSDKIAAIGELSDAQAAQTLDCTGFVISPGFVDIHSIPTCHYCTTLAQRAKYARASPPNARGSAASASSR